MPGYASDLLDLNGALSGHGGQPPVINRALPLAHRLIGQAERTGQGGGAAGLLDRESDGVRGHDGASITESNPNATTESYTGTRDHARMDTKADFSRRLNLALDEEGYPPSMSGRQTVLAKATNKSQPGVRKWLVGEALPNMTSAIELAKLINVNLEWLLSGRGPKAVEEEAPLSEAEKRFMSRLHQLSEDERARYFKVAEAMGLYEALNKGSKEDPREAA